MSLAVAASRLSARLQENLSEAARDFGLSNGLDAIQNATSSGAGKYLEPGALSTEDSLKEMKRLLSSNRDRDREEGLRQVLALLVKGRPVAAYFPLVTSCLSSTSINVRSLVSVYILRQAAMEPDLALMAVNLYQKDLQDSNPAIRAMALCVLTDMALEPIISLVVTSLRRSSRDSNWFVRKTVACNLAKLYQQDPAHLSTILPILSLLLLDKSALVVGSAMATFNALCPTHHDFLHDKYRHLCRALLDADEWGQIAILTTLTRYARRQLKKPQSSDGESEDLDSDLELLLKCAEPLLQSRNPAVTMSVIRLIFTIAPTDWHQKTLKPLLRLIHLTNLDEMQEIILFDLVLLTKLYSHLFSQPSFNHRQFYLRSSMDSSLCKKLKLHCLINLISADTFREILAELQLYALDQNEEFAMEAIKATGICCLISNHVEDGKMESVKALLGFLYTKNESIVSQAILILRSIFEQSQATSSQSSTLDPSTISKQLVQFLLADKISQPKARASIYWIAGQYATERVLSTFGPDLLRFAAVNFVKESAVAKMEIVNLAAKLVLLSHPSPYSANKKQLLLLFDYITTLARYDQDYPTRDRARFLKGLLSQTSITLTSAVDDQNEMASFSKGEEVSQSKHANVDGENQRPLVTAEQLHIMLFKLSESTESSLLPTYNNRLFGTLSLVAGKEIPNEQPLPGWTQSPTPSSLRDAADQTTSVPFPPLADHSRSSLSPSPSFTNAKGRASPVVLTPGDGRSQPRKPGFKDLDSFLQSEEESSSEEEEEEQSESEAETDSEAESASPEQSDDDSEEANHS